MALGRPITIWALSDGRAGIENQSLGAAEAVARLTPAEVVIKRVRFQRLFDRLPNALRPWPRAMLSQDSDRIDPPWPDLLIAAGRASLPFSTRMKRWSGGRTFVVQLQHPRTSLAPFDLVAPPVHDGLTGPNVLPLIGSPNRITPGQMEQARESFAEFIDPLPHPRIVALIGGSSKAFTLTADRAREIAETLVALARAKGGSLLVTFSRRTPQPIQDVMSPILARAPGWVWNGGKENPYFGFLARADHILVTEDSVNMAAEAGTTGKPVHILKLDGGSPKFAAFHAALRDRGVARPFEGPLDAWTYEPLAETDRLAREIVSRLERREA